MTQSAAWLDRCERSYERSHEARRDAADDEAHARDQLGEAIFEGLTAVEKADIFSDAWEGGMDCAELAAGLRSCWTARNPAEELLALRALGNVVVGFAEDAIGREIDRRVDETMEKARRDAQRGRCDD